MSVGIKHLEFIVSDKKRSMNFYKELFDIIGWKQVDHNGFSDGSTKIYFTEQKDAHFTKNIGPVHMCFRVGSKEVVEQVAGFLKKANMPYEDPVEKNYKGRKSYRVDFDDPDGYPLEVGAKVN